MKRRLVALFITVLLLYTITSCGNKKAGGKDGMVRDAVESISYRYPKNSEVRQVGNTKYIFFTKDSFVMADYTDVGVEMEEIPDLIIESAFKEGEESFSKDGWADAKRLSDLERIDYGGFHGWICRISMYDTDKNVSSRADMFVTYLDGKIISFVLISTEEEYEKTRPLFEELLDSLELA